MMNTPTEPGGFDGDIYYGDPIKTTMGTHRWQGGKWHELPSETEAVLGLLAKARTDLAAALDREAATYARHDAKMEDIEVCLATAVGALRFYADLSSEGPWHLPSEDYGKRARTTLAEIGGGKDD
jgi:hypothetical protein